MARRVASPGWLVTLAPHAARVRPLLLLHAIQDRKRPGCFDRAFRAPVTRAPTFVMLAVFADRTRFAFVVFPVPVPDFLLPVRRVPGAPGLAHCQQVTGWASATHGPAARRLPLSLGKRFHFGRSLDDAEPGKAVDDRQHGVGQIEERKREVGKRGNTQG